MNKKRDVLAALAQGVQVDDNHANPVIKVTAHFSLCYKILHWDVVEIAVIALQGSFGFSHPTHLLLVTFEWLDTR